MKNYDKNKKAGQHEGTITMSVSVIKFDTHFFYLGGSQHAKKETSCWLYFGLDFITTDVFFLIAMVKQPNFHVH